MLNKNSALTAQTQTAHTALALALILVIVIVDSSYKTTNLQKNTVHVLTAFAVRKQKENNNKKKSQIKRLPTVGTLNSKI